MEKVLWGVTITAKHSECGLGAAKELPWDNVFVCSGIVSRHHQRFFHQHDDCT